MYVHYDQSKMVDIVNRIREEKVKLADPMPLRCKLSMNFVLKF